MTIFEEAYVSREGPTGEQTSRDVIWLSFQEPDIEQARLDLSSFAPIFYNCGGGLLLPRRTITPKQLTDNIYEWTVNYGTDQNQTQQSDPDVSQFNTTLTFNLVGGTQHINTALDTTSYVATGSPTDIKNAIGLDLKTGQVRGVDIFAPVLDYTLTTQFPNRIVTQAYIDDLFDLTGTTNKAVFKGRPIGSVLFKGAHGSKRGSENWEVGFEFAYSKNRTDFQVGGLITVTSKKGWEYMDVMYREDSTTTIAGKPIQIPAQVNIHKVYEDGDFSKMKIGV